DAQFVVLPGKQPLAKPPTVSFFKNFIGTIAGAQDITMVQVEGFTAPPDDEFVVDDGRTEFIFQVPKHPHVVVALEERNLYALVGQFGQFTQKPDIAFGNYRGIFKPEIKD